MFLYKRKDSPFWYISYQDGNKRRGRVLHKFLGYVTPITHKDRAYRLFAEWEKRKEKEYLGLIPKTEIPLSVMEFYREYGRYCDLNKAKITVASDKYRLKAWLEFLGKEQIAFVHQITKAVLTRFLAASGNRTNATMNRYTALIKASLKWGVDQGHLKENPVAGFRRLTETRQVELAEISGEDLKKMFTIEDEKFRLFLRFVYYTPRRKGEILFLTWGDLDLKKRLVTFRKSKSNVPRILPMADKLFEAVNSYNGSLGEKGDKVFDWTVPYVTRKFQRLRDRLGLQIRSIHKFRHARASELLRKGANIRDVQGLLGHKTPSTTLQIYAFSSLIGLKETVNK